MNLRLRWVILYLVTSHYHPGVSKLFWALKEVTQIFWITRIFDTEPVLSVWFEKDCREGCTKWNGRPRAACANRSKDGLEQRIRKDVKKWLVRVITRKAPFRAKWTLGSWVRISPHLCVIFYSTHGRLSCSST
jgi:hypothetical protein